MSTFWRDIWYFVNNIVISPSRQGGRPGTWTTSNSLTTLAKRRKVSALSFWACQRALSSSWSLYLASTSPMHLDVNVVKMFNTLRMQCSRIDKLLSLKKMHSAPNSELIWIWFCCFYLLRPLPNVSSLSLLINSPSFARVSDDQIPHKSAPYFRLFWMLKGLQNCESSCNSWICHLHETMVCPYTAV